MPRRTRCCCNLLFFLAFARVYAPTLASASTPSSAPLANQPDQFWSLEPLHKPALPPTKTKGWAQSPIDTFILAKLEASHMRPAARANKRHLLRRVTFDLPGLPPTPNETRAFLNDRSPNPFSKVIERL